MKKTLSIFLCLILVLSVIAGCSNKPSKSDKKVDISIILVLEDETQVSYEVNVTEGSSIREALLEAKLVGEEAETAFFIEDIDGHVALAEDGVLWYLCDADQNPLGTVDDVLVEEGATYLFIYTVAPNFDD